MRAGSRRHVGPLARSQSLRWHPAPQEVLDEFRSEGRSGPLRSRASTVIIKLRER